MNPPRNMQLIRDIDDNRVDYSGGITGCNACHVGKSTQPAHLKTEFKQACHDVLQHTGKNTPVQIRPNRAAYENEMDSP